VKFIRLSPSGGWWLAVFFYVLVLPTSARAHAQIKGMGEFSGGLLHPLITLPHLLTLLGLGLWLGQHPPLRLRAPMLLFMTFSGVGLLMTTRVSMPAAWQPVLILMALGIAILVALSARLAAWVSVPIFAAAALMMGLDSGVDAGPPLTTVAMTLLGTWISLNLCLLNFSYYTSLCPPRQWVQIGIRVAGSWIAAICLLVLAFALKANSLA
jgi:hydrogenase/urease accessory protein HupE